MAAAALKKGLWFIGCHYMAPESNTSLGCLQERRRERKEQNRTEQNRTEQNRTEQNRTEQNRFTQQNKHSRVLLFMALTTY
jgi:hypothetical protein